MWREEVCTVRTGAGPFFSRPKYSSATWRTMRSTVALSMETGIAVLAINDPVLPYAV